MGMAQLTDYHTADMVRELIDESRPSPRYETAYGELLVTPPPDYRHQRVVGRLLVALAAYLEREPLVGGVVLASPADISWGRRDVLVQPDVFVVPEPGSPRPRWDELGSLLLAAEVVSPSSRRADRFTKRRVYQETHTPLYWVLDPMHDTAELWRPDAVEPQVERERLLWHPVGATEPFTLAVAELFRER